MSMTMEQIVPQQQQELLTLRAQVAAESGHADEALAINNLATAQVRKDTPNFTDVIRRNFHSTRTRDRHLSS